MCAERDAYHELQSYTLGLADAEFIHQYVVDAWTAQHADENTKPIGLTFALVGLYLHVERRFTGRNIQRVHMLIARRPRAWPEFRLPLDRGTKTASDVMAVSPAERGRAIDEWCEAVWSSYGDNHRAVVEFLEQNGFA